ncbi:MAG: hypothetical protein EF813_05500 [Methanosarcinales archaeon]|nr:MAG: hypothetical protein EF813_05500 [Methanosarcinales archaeon]
MSARTIILCIAVIAIGIFMLPQTLSMFSGQHSWYDPSDDAIPCEKCHWLESGELTSCAYGLHSPHRSADREFECTECHNVTMDVSYYFETGAVGEHTPAHAATTVSCLACHGDLFSNGTFCAASCHDTIGDANEVNVMHILATKYNMVHSVHSQQRTTTECLKCHKYYDDSVSVMKANVFINHIDTELSHSLESHREFFLGMSGENITKSESGLSGPNEACIGCHTSSGVNISWTRYGTIEFTAGKPDGKWHVGEMSATGDNVTFISTDG